MIRLTARLADGKSMNIQAKSSWQELTYAELLRIENEPGGINPLFLFSILTGFDFDEIANSTDERIMDVLAGVTEFIYDTPVWKDIQCPTNLVIDGRPYPIPMDINKIILGQKILLGQLAALKDINIFQMIPRATAIMMSTVYYGKFDKNTEDKMDELKQKILQSDALSVYGAGQFFFLKSAILSSIGKHSLKMSQQLKMKMA